MTIVRISTNMPFMSDIPQNPDYELPSTVAITNDAQRKAVADPLRRQILDLVLERAASVTELAAALDRPKSSVAYHVDVLESHGLLRVVRTRKVRAMQERFYGRTGRTVVHESIDGKSFGSTSSERWLVEALNEIRPGTEEIMATMRHVRIPESAALEFFQRVSDIAEEFTQLNRDGDTVYGLVAAIYPTDLPILPEPQ
ncbi:MAG: ArsR/SmtB family transcription factor [Acidimicrobiales bacterium]